MGIVVADDGADGTELRHCTASEDWLSRKVFTTGTIFEGLPLEQQIPLHGFRSDAVKFIWPGTITQTVEVAYKSYRDVQYRGEVYELDNEGNYLWENDEYGMPQRILRDKYAVLDPVREGTDRGTGGRYRIAALTFDPVWVPKNGDTPEHWAHPLIVQPCRSKRTPAVSRALERMADACKQLRGHYRLFAYTNGRIGDFADGPVTLEGLWEPRCRNGQYIVEPVEKTRGMVCSTFIWEAVQFVNLPPERQRIVLDGRPLLPEPASARDDRCSELTTRWGRRRSSPGDPSISDDGFYLYSALDRAGAGEALQKKLVEKVMKHLSKFLDEIAGPPLLGAVEGAYTGVRISQLLAWNPLYLVLILGVSKPYLDAEVQKLRDTATHLSNQWGDTFRKDNAAQDNESDDWRHNPGTGSTVSPDDILNSWSAPHYEDNDQVVGVYGSNIRAEVLSPAPIEGEWRPSTWEITTDVTSLGVRVFRSDANGNPVYLPDALVRVGCAELITKQTDSNGQFLDMTMPQRVPGVPGPGRYFARAVWTDTATNNFQWRSPRKIVEVPGPTKDLEVFPPKESRRQISIHGKAELLNRHATDEIPVIGTDPWEQTVFFDSGLLLMGMDFSNINPEDDPEFFAWLQQNYGGDLKGLQERSWPLEFQMEDWGIVRVIFTCKLDPTGSITLTIKGGTREGTDPSDNTEPDWGQTDTRQIPPKLGNTDPGVSFNVKVERTGFAVAPVRATLHVTVDNNQQPG